MESTDILIRLQESSSNHNLMKPCLFVKDLLGFGLAAWLMAGKAILIRKESTFGNQQIDSLPVLFSTKVGLTMGSTGAREARFVRFHEFGSRARSSQPLEPKPHDPKRDKHVKQSVFGNRRGRVYR